MTDLGSVEKYVDIPHYGRISKVTHNMITRRDRYGYSYMGAVYKTPGLHWENIPDLTVARLKQLLKVIGNKTSGIKKDLVYRLMTAIIHHCSAIHIQRIFRGWMINRVYKLFSKYEKSRQLCVNDTDFYNLDNLCDIPKFKFISFVDDVHSYGFSLHSLYTLTKTTPSINPYTRQKISKNIICQIKWIYKIDRLKILNEIDHGETAQLHIETRYSLRVVDLFQFINNLGNYSDPAWYLELSLPRISLLFRYLKDIWYYRSGISWATMSAISPSGDPFLAPTPPELNTPDIDAGLYFKFKILQILEMMVYSGIDRDSKTLGAMYVLSALTLVSDQASSALPWLYNSVYDNGV